MQTIAPSGYVDKLKVFTSRIDLVAKYGQSRVQAVKAATGSGTMVLKFRGVDVPGGQAFLGDVAHIGTGPAVTLSGTPTGSHDFQIKIDLGGDLGVGTFKWSVDGGATWVAEDVSLAADVTLGTTGVHALFAAGTYVLDECYDFDSVVGDTRHPIDLAPIGQAFAFEDGDELVAEVASIEAVSGVTEVWVSLAPRLYP